MFTFSFLIMSDVHTQQAHKRPSGGPVPEKALTNAALLLPVVDKEQLTARLYSYAPLQSSAHSHALTFSAPTIAQSKKAAIRNVPSNEPLVREHSLCFKVA